jgi:hypothetical protein
MKLLLATAVLAITFATQTAYAADEPPLTEKNKSQLAKILKGALRDKDITNKQYEQALFWIHARPCSGVERSLTVLRRDQLQVAIAKERKRKSVKVFESFKSDGWFVLFTDASDGDEPYLFYSSDPATGSHPVTAWSGAATIYETSEVAQWVKVHAPGIPSRVANCFAWHVTLSP